MIPVPLQILQSYEYLQIFVFPFQAPPDSMVDTDYMEQKLNFYLIPKNIGTT